MFDARSPPLGPRADDIFPVVKLAFSLPFRARSDPGETRSHTSSDLGSPLIHLAGVQWNTSRVQATVSDPTDGGVVNSLSVLSNGAPISEQILLVRSLKYSKAFLG
ncbi:hypothetical protein BRADI_2g57093v3 [Brachypodium distachyon]|uniref:Uncharacterized protein n=1 Tax=Brachypodium distachyon TaxID=15368 RepID=A0A2K2DGC1_BRADI|nr:hypothetical protein BRADI_2g57093v3 [Brachypodium distachyon]